MREVQLIPQQRNLKGGTNLKKTIAVLGVVVLALSLTAVAADNTRVTTQGKPGGTAYKAAGQDASLPIIFSNLATKDPKGLYFCCEGNIISGPDNAYGYPAYAEAIQFVVTSATTLHKITTSVNYIAEGTYTDFLFAIEADASGVPSGTALGSGPWKVTINSQTFGQCCATEVGKAKGGLALAPGTYWVVWETEAASDLFAEVNVEVFDEVDSANVAYSASNGAAGSWTSYGSVDGFNVEVQ